MLVTGNGRTLAAIAIIFAMITGAGGRISAAGLSALHVDASGASAEDAPGAALALVAIGDFNRDGIADIAEANLPAGDPSGARFLTVLLGQADGTFKEAATHPVLGHDPRSIVVGDFNGDGNLDLIVGDGDGALMELIGDGKGNLVSAGEIAHLGSVVSIAKSDFNHDGIPDLAVSDFRANSVTILLGAGNGSFRPSWSFPLPMRGTIFHLAAADFNGDGIPDLAITNDDEDTFEVMLGNGNGTFTYAPALSNVKDPNSYCPT
jgi:hypothetical protein